MSIQKLMETNNGLFKILDSEKGKDLFRSHIQSEILQKVNVENSCQCSVFEELKYKFIDLDNLEDQRVLSSFSVWLEFHRPSNPLTNNIHWNVRVDRDIAHHLFRDGVNEANENILTQGFNLIFFTHANQGDSNSAFWLYTKETAEGISFIATTMVFFGFNDLFLFDENGMCLNK
jgi:hypothetical protein